MTGITSTVRDGDNMRAGKNSLRVKKRFRSCIIFFVIYKSRLTYNQNR